MVNSSKKNYKEKVARRQELKPEEPETPKYRDRAKERREDQNPDYEPTELGTFHAVPPPGAFDIRLADSQKLSIEKSKYLGGDVEHTHLVKGLDYALLNKVRSEIDKKVDSADDVEEKFKIANDDTPVSFRTAMAKSVYQSIVKHQSSVKTNEMFLPGRMAFIFNMESGHANDIPTVLHRSKDDCPVPEEMVAISVDKSVLDEIGKIMTYLRMGSSGKVKKKKKDKDSKGKFLHGNTFNGESKSAKVNGEILPPPPKINGSDLPEKLGPRLENDDIFVGDGVDYSVPGKDITQSPIVEDMEESPRNNKERVPYFNEPEFGPVPPSAPTQEWQDTGGYDVMPAQTLATVYPGEWQDYQYADQLVYPDQYLQQSQLPFDISGGSNMAQDPRFMTQEEKDRGLGSVFKRDDERLQHLREKDAREKDPNFISDSYSECYPGYQEYHREIVDSDDEDDLSKMDMGGRAKGRLHRWDFETEDEWAKYNEQKEAMPKAAFQFGVKMQDGRKTRKQNREQNLNNELHQINKILARKKIDKEPVTTSDMDDDDNTPSGKKRRI